LFGKFKLCFVQHSNPSSRKGKIMRKPQIRFSLVSALALLVGLTFAPSAAHAQEALTFNATDQAGNNLFAPTNIQIPEGVLESFAFELNNPIDIDFREGASTGPISDRFHLNTFSGTF